MTRRLWAGLAVLAAVVVAEGVWVRAQVDDLVLRQLQHDHRLRRVEAPHDALNEYVELPGDLS